MTYQEKLKDPRWQKKRLEILNRDDFACQKCFDTESTLHIHHRRYIKDTEPWDYKAELLVTLCKDCHEAEKEELKEYVPMLIDILKSKFFASDISDLAHGFHNMPMMHRSEVQASATEWFLSNDENIKLILDLYMDNLGHTKKAKFRGDNG